VTVKRLNPLIDEDWDLFYQLCGRVREACRRGLSNFNEDILVSMLKKGFVNDSSLFLIVVLNDHNQIISHLVGWIIIEFDKEIFFIHQAVSDVNLGNYISPIWSEIRMMLPKNVVIRFWTKRVGFERYFKKLGMNVKNKYTLLEV